MSSRSCCSIANPPTAPHPFFLCIFFVCVAGRFLGKGSAQEASKALEGKRDGTYLVRESRKRPGEYVLGIVFGGKVIHVVVKSNENEQGGTYYCLNDSADAPRFDDVEDMLFHYRKEAIGTECNTPLILPYKEA